MVLVCPKRNGPKGTPWWRLVQGGVCATLQHVEGNRAVWGSTPFESCTRSPSCRQPSTRLVSFVFRAAGWLGTRVPAPQEDVFLYAVGTTGAVDCAAFC